MKQHTRFFATAFALLIWGTVTWAHQPQQPVQTASASASIKPNPPVMDENMLDIQIVDAAKKPIAGLKFTATVAMTSMDMGTAHPTVKETSPGHYQTKPLFLMNGPWRVTIVSKSPALKIPLDFEIGNKKKWTQDPILISLGNPATPTKGSGEANPDEKPTVAPEQQAPTPPALAPTPAEPTTKEPQTVPDMLALHSSALVPELHEKTSYVVNGDENWEIRTGFGKNYQMVAMMFLMMVEGSGMEGMKMAVMNMNFGQDTFTEIPGEASPPLPSMNSDLMVDAKVMGSPKVGDNEVQISLMDGKGNAVTGAKITATVAMTSMDMGTTHPKVQEIGKGLYNTNPAFSMAGPWRLTLVAAASDGKSGTFSFEFEAK